MYEVGLLILADEANAVLAGVEGGEAEGALLEESLHIEGVEEEDLDVVVVWQVLDDAGFVLSELHI